MVQTPAKAVYLGQLNRSLRVLLKVVRVTLHNAKRSLETFALLNDTSNQTIILPATAQQLELQGNPEVLSLQASLRQKVVPVKGVVVSFSISPAGQNDKKYQITSAFTAKSLTLSEHSCPVELLQW